MTFTEAKAKANKIGGVVTWWCGYIVWPAAEYSYDAGCGTAKFISKKAAAYYKEKYRQFPQKKL